MPIKIKKSSNFVSGQKISIRKVEGGVISMYRAPQPRPVPAIFFAAPGGQIVKFQEGIFTTQTTLIESPETFFLTRAVKVSSSLCLLFGTAVGEPYYAAMWEIQGSEQNTSNAAHNLGAVPGATGDHYVIAAYNRNSSEVVAIGERRDDLAGQNMDAWVISHDGSTVTGYPFTGSSILSLKPSNSMITSGGDVLLFGGLLAPGIKIFTASNSFVDVTLPYTNEGTYVVCMTELPNGNLVAIGDDGSLWELDALYNVIYTASLSFPDVVNGCFARSNDEIYVRSEGHINRIMRSSGQLTSMLSNASSITHNQFATFETIENFLRNTDGKYVFVGLDSLDGVYKIQYFDPTTQNSTYSAGVENFSRSATDSQLILSDETVVVVGRTPGRFGRPETPVYISVLIESETGPQVTNSSYDIGGGFGIVPRWTRS